MTTETVDDKATRLLAERRLRILWATDEALSARVRGDSGVHDIHWSRSRGWSCSCPCRQRCSHLIAVGSITVLGRVPKRRPPTSFSSFRFCFQTNIARQQEVQ